MRTSIRTLKWDFIIQKPTALVRFSGFYFNSIVVFLDCLHGNAFWGLSILSAVGLNNTPYRLVASRVRFAFRLSGFEIF